MPFACLGYREFYRGVGAGEDVTPLTVPLIV